MRRWMARIAGTAALALLMTAWLLLAPTQIGGQATYVMTEGVSMLPTYHSGDLVILRRESAYNVGDAVAYADPDIGQIFHRIVGLDGDRYVMKGDNNEHVDSFRPRISDILGRLWVYVPSGASMIKTARQPTVAAGLAGGAVLLAAVPIRRTSRVRRRFFHRGPRSARAPRSPGSASVLGPAGQVLASLAIGVALLSVIGAAVSFSQPTERSTAVSVAYTQSGTFAYTASGAPAAVYDGGSVTTGDPVYRRLTPRLQVSFDYSLGASRTTATRGTAALVAVVGAENGWKRSFLLQPAAAFQGPAVRASGTLDLNRVAEAVTAYEKATGLNIPTFSLDIVPTVEVTGTVDGADVRLTYEPRLGLTFDGDQLALPAADGDPVHPRADGKATHQALVPASISLLVLSPRVEAVRTLSLAGLALAGLALLGLLALGLNAARARQVVRIQGRYSPLLVALSGSDLGSQGRIFDVATMEDLVRVAEREARMILHETQGDVHNYYVQDADVTYRYRVVDEAEQAAIQEATP